MYGLNNTIKANFKGELHKYLQVVERDNLTDLSYFRDKKRDGIRNRLNS
jgi:hypothetical protein